MPDNSTETEADRDDVDEEEQPEIDGEEMADLSAVADEIEDAAGAGADDQDDVDGRDRDDVVDEGQDGERQQLGTAPSRGWGDMYVSSVTTSLNAVIEERGKDGAEPIDEQMARDLHLDEAFDEWMAQRARSEMEPGQEVLLGTLILASSTLATKTDIVGEIAADIGGEGSA
jgi:hypothetical protein